MLNREQAGFRCKLYSTGPSDYWGTTARKLDVTPCVFHKSRKGYRQDKQGVYLECFTEKGHFKEAETNGATF